MRLPAKVRGLTVVLATVTLLPSAGSAILQELVSGGVSVLADNLPELGDPVLIWATVPDCTDPGPRAHPRGGMPGDEVRPYLITRASLAIAEPRTLYAFNPDRPVATCNPYRLISNIFEHEGFLYYADNQGPDGRMALWKRRRDANVFDQSQLLVDLGRDTTSVEIIVFGVSLIIISNSDNIFVVPSSIIQYHKDTGELLNGNIDSGDELSLQGLRFDGRYLYWTKDGVLRRNDTTNGELLSLPITGVDQLVMLGYEEQCGPKGCEELSRIVYSIDHQIFETETIRNNVTPVYTSPVSAAQIVGLVRGPVHYYFVERRPFSGFTGEFRIFRLAVGGTMPELIHGPVMNDGYEGLRTDFEWLYFRDVSTNRLLRLSNDAAAIPISDLRGTGLEVTQGVQNSANDVRLIANKRTIVRFYARSASGADVPGVTAALVGANASGFLGRLEPINAGGRTITLRANPSRTTLDDSFQFELPLHWTSGGRLSLSAAVDPARRFVENNTDDNAFSADFDFSPSERLLVIYYNWAYDLGGTRYTPSATDVASSRNRMARVYPLSEPGSAFESPGLHTVTLDFVDNALTSQVDRTNADCVKRYKKPADRNMCASDYVHGRMMALRRNSGIAAGAVSYGNIAQAPAPMGLSYFTRGYANGQYGSGPSTDANYAAHEVGHVLQRGHPVHGSITCGHSADDADYPHNGARIETLPSNAETRLQGLDFTPGDLNTLTLLDGGTFYDTMSYCQPYWISDYTYEGMYQYLVSDGRPRLRQTAPLQAVAGDWLIAAGTLDPPDEEGGFTVVQRVDSVMDATPPVAGGFTLELRNGGGGVLASHPFTAHPIADEPGKQSFDVVVAFTPGTAELRVVEDATDRVLATREVSGTPPVVSDVQLPGAPDPVDGIVTVTWNGSDADGDPLIYDLYASLEGGEYRPVHLGIAATSVALDSNGLGGGQTRLRVVASDGVHTAVAESAPFTVADRPPKVVILNPESDTRADFGQLVTLQVQVEDPQGEEIPDSEIFWINSNLGGAFANGRIVQTTLPVGVNNLQVQAVNRTNRIGSDSVTVVVSDVLAGPGPTLSVAPQNIAWHVAADDLAPQVRDLAVANRGRGTLQFHVRSDAAWLLIDSQMAIEDAVAPQSFTIIATPAMLPADTTSRATLTFENADDPADVVVVPIELSRGTVYDNPPGSQGGGCAGDCDGSGDVAIAELIRGVNIAIGNTAVDECAAIDTDASGTVNINELISAVLAALQGC